MNKSYTSVVLAIIIFTIAIFTAMNFHNIDTLESRINTVKKYYKLDSNKLKSEKLFKEDYYILQQSRDTTLLLAVFGAVGLLVGFFTYQNVHSRFDLKVAEISTQYDQKAIELKNEVTKYKKEWNKLQDKLDDLKIHFYIDNVNLSRELAESHFSKREKENYLMYTIRAASKFADLIRFLKEKSDELNSEADTQFKNDTIEQFTDQATSLLSRLNVNIGDGQSLKIKPQHLTTIETDIENTRTINNDKISRFLSDIHSKITRKNES